MHSPLVNHGPGRDSYGYSFSLECYVKAQWVNVRFASWNAAWLQGLRVLAPGKHVEQSLTIPKRGRYRITKHVDEGGTHLVRSVGFDVTTQRRPAELRD